MTSPSLTALRDAAETLQLEAQKPLAALRQAEMLPAEDDAERVMTAIRGVEAAVAAAAFAWRAWRAEGAAKA